MGMAATRKNGEGDGPAPLPAKLAGLLREAKWLAFTAVAAYLLLVFFTFHKGDPGWSHSATNAVTQNAGGRVGACDAARQDEIVQQGCGRHERRRPQSLHENVPEREKIRFFTD